MPIKKIGDKKLGFQSEYMIPSVALYKDENILVLLHNLNGDGKATEWKKILDMYQNIQSKDDDFTKVAPTSKCTICGTYMTEDDAIIYQKKSYCSKECLEKAQKR